MLLELVSDQGGLGRRVVWCWSVVGRGPTVGVDVWGELGMSGFGGQAWVPPARSAAGAGWSSALADRRAIILKPKSGFLKEKISASLMKFDLQTDANY